ncbi:ABC transporter permease [Phreatobacter aquaticus]|uniref:ABC transporter permease n=1 Tax=Phreatobacter aquaticus TaxID=2570229 RepID=A0A4D7QGW7_9HYPH|nr:ABC transporter permease [Phreatobacter aquaticus]QCK85941.1 ABC transporter permease [Phreatobacter aquaticus]
MNERLALARYILAENPLNLVALVLFLALLGCAIFGPSIVPYDPIATQTSVALQPPSLAHWFGTDQLGRDVFSRVVVATRLDFLIAFSAVILSMAAGAMIGATIGYFGGGLDATVSRVVDVLMAFPLFVLAMAMVAALGNSVSSVVYATAVINLPFYIRLARAEVSVRRGLGYVEAARVGGSGHGRILTAILIPNVLPSLVVQASLNLGWAVLNAAGLSFIGLGVRAPTPEWGIMVAEGAQFIVSGRWWLALFPGLALMLAVFSFNLLGDGLRDIVDPRSRT